MHADIVDHPLHGPGRVVAYQRGGRLALVEFKSLRLPTLVPVRELVGTTDILPPTHALPIKQSTPIQGTHDRNFASRALEAMRLGVVPDHDLSTYTVGRQRELEQVDADLQDTETEGGQVRAFLADYGVGKTHLLEMISQRALAAGYLTANVVLDAAAVAPSHPKRVYRALIRSLKYPDRPLEEGCGLAPLLERAAQSESVLRNFGVDPIPTKSSFENEGEDEDDGTHLYLTPAIAYMRALADENLSLHLADKLATDDPDVFADYAREQLLDWIEGHPTTSSIIINEELKVLPGRFPHIYSMSDYRPWARIYSYIISGISTLARQLGYAGLVVLIDEAELYTLLSSENREFATILFKALSAASLGTEKTPFDAADLNLGGRGVLQRLPPRYGNEPGLYTVFAMTPNEDGIETMHEAIPRSQTSEISAISADDYDELTAKICDFYASARSQNTLDQSTVHSLTTLIRQTRHSGFLQNPREAMKLLIELLDIHYYHPDQLSRVITELQRKMF